MLAGCLDKLAPAAREAVVLRYQELSYERLPRSRGASRHAAATIARAMPVLRKCVEARQAHHDVRRYWREGVVSYERGQIDPHLEGCVDCQQARAACAQMIGRCLWRGDDVVGDPFWQAKVLECVDAREARPWSRWAGGPPAPCRGVRDRVRGCSSGAT